LKLHTPTEHPLANGYTHGVEVEGRLLFISGQVPRRPDEGPVSEDPAEQLRQIWRNIANVLDCAGASLSDLVHVRVYLADRAYKQVFSEVRREVLGEYKPGVTVVICGIWDERWVAEIEAVAELGGGRAERAA
jgi:2-iminobutanoate/2-iminopropanoate deaminase